MLPCKRFQPIHCSAAAVVVLDIRVSLASTPRQIVDVRHSSPFAPHATVNLVSNTRPVHNLRRTEALSAGTPSIKRAPEAFVLPTWHLQTVSSLKRGAMARRCCGKCWTLRKQSTGFATCVGDSVSSIIQEWLCHFPRSRRGLAATPFLSLLHRCALILQPRASILAWAVNT